MIDKQFLNEANGVPVAVVIKAAGLFEDAGELHVARAHVVNVSPGVLVAVFKSAFVLGLAPGCASPARTAAINDAGVEEETWSWLRS